MIAYEQLNPHIQTGDLCLFSGGGVWSKLIQFGTGSPWSHVGIFYRWSKRVFIVEAREPEGVRCCLASDVLDHYNGSMAYRQLIVDRDQDFHDRAEAFLDSVKHYKYAWLDLPNAWLGYGKRSRKGAICSGLYTDFLSVVAHVIPFTFTAAPPPKFFALYHEYLGPITELN